MVVRDGHEAEDKSYELGDLELAPARSPPQAEVRFPKPRNEEHDELPTLSTFTPSLPANDFDLAFDHGSLPSDPEHGDDLAATLAGPAIELELDVPQPTTSARPEEAGRRPSAPQGSGRPGSVSSKPEHDLQREARELAGYGETPDGFIASARYLLRVAQRTWSLRRERRATEAEAGERAVVYERALDALGRALLNDAEVCAHDGLRAHVAEVEAKQRALAEVEATTRDARSREESALKALHEARAKLESELAPFLDEEQRASALHTKLETELKRKQAQLQRAEIELRALSKASIPPPPERVEGITVERQRREAELAEVSARHAEATAALGRARRDLALRRGGLDALERQHEERMAKARALHGRLDADVSMAERALRIALCALAEAADRLEVPHTAADEIAEVRAAESALDAIVEQLTRYDRALSLYDRDALVRGALLYFALAMALVLFARLV